jgi:hypothetical protein
VDKYADIGTEAYENSAELGCCRMRQEVPDARNQGGRRP